MQRKAHAPFTWCGRAAMVFAIGACSSSTRTSGGDDAAGAAPRDAGGADVCIRGQTCDPVIGPQGGTLLTDSGARLVIPPGALADDTAIAFVQISAPPYDGVVSAGYGLAPNGLRFAVPATLTIPIFTAVDSPHLYWIQTSGNTEDHGGIVSESRITAQITGFGFGWVQQSSDAGVDTGP